MGDKLKSQTFVGTLPYVPDAETAMLVYDKAEELRSTDGTDNEAELLHRAARELGYWLHDRSAPAWPVRESGDYLITPPEGFVTGDIVLVGGRTLAKVIGFGAPVKLDVTGESIWIHGAVARVIPRY